MTILTGFGGGKFGLSLRRELYGDLAKYLQDGVAIRDALQDMHDEYKNRNGNKRVVDATAVILAGLSNGFSFARSLKGRIPDSEQAALYAGEKSGDPVKALMSVVEVAEASQKIRKTVIMQLMYPALLFGALFGVVHVMAGYALPIMASAIDESLWSPAFSSYYHSVRWFADNSLLILLALCALIGGAFAALKLPFRIRLRMDGWWPWGLYRSIQSAIFLMSLSNLMRSGRALSDSLDDIHSQSSPFVRDYVHLFKERVSRGMKAGKSLDVPFFDRAVAIRLAISSKHRGFEDAMQSVAREAVENTITEVTRGLMGLRAIGMLLVFGYIVWTLFAVFEFGESAKSAATMMQV